MASNTQLNSGTGGDVVVTKLRSHDGDATAKQQGVFLSGVSGTEDAYTFTDVQAGGGTEATALRVTIASDSTGVLSIDDNGGSLTVDGTVAVTGVATAANQTTMIGHLDGVEGILTTIDADTGNLAAAIKAEDAVHASGDTGVMALAVRQDANTTLVSASGDYSPLQVDSSGSLKVAIISGAGSGGTAMADGATFTRNTTSLTPAGAVVETSAPTLTNGDVAGLSMTTAGALRVEVASGGITGRAEDAAAAGGEDGVPVLAVRRDVASSGVSADGDWANLSVDSNGALRVTGAGGGTQFAEDVAHTTGDTGTMVLAVRRDTAAVGSGTDGDYSTLNVNSSGRLYTTATIDAAIPAGTNNIGDVDVLTIAAGTNTIGNVGVAPRTTGGLTTFHLASAGSTNATNIKASAGQVFGWYIYNSNASARKVAFHNTAGTPTAGASVFFSLVIPPASGANVFSDVGMAFSTGIAITTVTGLADNDSAAVAANDLIINIWYA